MTRITFGVSASSFAANMSVKQNSLYFETEYPQATQAVKNSFYVDDGLAGADSVDQAIQLQGEFQESFMKGGFLLNSEGSHPQRLSIPHLAAHASCQERSQDPP